MVHVYGHKQGHTRVQCSHASMGLTPAHLIARASFPPSLAQHACTGDHKIKFIHNLGLR